MAFIIVSLFVAIVACVQAQSGHGIHSSSYHTVVYHDRAHHLPEHDDHPIPHHDHDEYAQPIYNYVYGVEDPHTGDLKTQQESRDGDVVDGEYSFLQPDGVFRKVHYHDDGHSGFQASVQYTDRSSQYHGQF